MSTKLLAIEDDEDTADSLRSLLQAYGYEVRTTSPANAEAALDQFKPAAVLLHLGHPNNPWTNLVRAMRASDPALPIIGLTAWGVTAFQDVAAGAGFVAMLGKPVDIDALLRVLPPAQ